MGVHDNVFDIGGDSLLIAQLRNRLRSAFRQSLSIVDLFRYPTISALARYLEEGAAPADVVEAAVDRARKQRRSVGPATADGALGTLRR